MILIHFFFPKCSFYIPLASSFISTPLSSIFTPLSSQRMTDLFFRFSMHNILSLHSSTKETIKTSEEEFSNTFGNICRLTFNVSFLNTMYLSGSSPDVSRKQQQQKTIKKKKTEVITTTKITTIFPFSEIEIKYIERRRWRIIVG